MTLLLLSGTAAFSLAQTAAEQDPANEGAPPPTTTAAADGGSVRFVAYNLKNWLDMERRVQGEVTTSNKPDAEKTAVVKMLGKLQPTILGVCEIGGEKDVIDLQTRLKAAGVDLPHRVVHGGADAVRHLAVLSKYPVTGNQSVKDLTYTLEGKTFGVQRGILDVTLQVAPDYQLRLMGNHLKSRREVDEGDQALMRRHEATLLRQHIDKVLAAQPDVNLLVYGDFNDTKNEPPIKTVQGAFGSKGYLRDIWLRDRDGLKWTYYWDFADVYERIDFTFVSDGLWPEIDTRSSAVADSPDWNKASDHRPLLLVIDPQNKAKRGR